MTLYHTGLSNILIEEFLPSISCNDTIKHQQIIAWVNEHYPLFSNSTITNWLARLTTNSPARLNWRTGIKEYDVFFKIDNRSLRLYDPATDPSPIYHKENISSNEELYADIEYINSDSKLSSTEKESLIKSRIGQGEFRQNVINFWGLGETCLVTKVNIREMLTASHIKPWRDCESKEERLDGANGILLCSHLDKLFDNHLISFKLKNSKFVCEVNKSLNKSHLESVGIRKGLQLAINNLNSHDIRRFNIYMQEHYNIFSGKNDGDR